MINGVSTIPVASRPPQASLAVRSDLGGVCWQSDVFVAGEENRLLAAVVGQWQQILKAGLPLHDDEAWHALASPLALVGATGSGKTHLAKELADLAGPDASYFAPASDWRRDFVAALETEQAFAWRQQMASRRLVVIDDIDHLPGSSESLHELLHLVDELASRGHKLVVTTARPLAHVRGWPAELINRFASGLTVEIAPLGQDARRQLLTQFANHYRWQLTAAAFDRLVELAPPTPRDLIALAGDLQRQFGSGTRLEADTLDHFLQRRKAAHAPELHDIARLVARYYRLPLKSLTSSSRQAPVVTARATTIYLARKLTAASYEQIGRLLGGRDHTTILHGYRRTVARLPREPALRDTMDELSRLLQK